MKKIIALFAAASMMLLMTACGGNSNETTESQISTSEVAGEQTDSSGNVIIGTPHNGEVAPETEEYRRHIELSDVYDEVMAIQPAELEPLVMMPEDGYSQLVEALYPDMARFDYNQMELYAPPVTGFPCEIMMVEAKYEVDADHAEDVFLERIEKGAADEAYPENAEGWMLRAEVQRDGFYVAMIVLPEGYEIPNNVFDLVAG